MSPFASHAGNRKEVATRSWKANGTSFQLANHLHLGAGVRARVGFAARMGQPVARNFCGNPWRCVCAAATILARLETERTPSWRGESEVSEVGVWEDAVSACTTSRFRERGLLAGLDCTQPLSQQTIWLPTTRRSDSTSGSG